MAKKKGRFLNFFKDVKSELKKVTWPSFKQVKNNTLIVIACVLIIGAFIWILDAVFGLSLGKVIEKMQEPQQNVQQQTNTIPATDFNIETDGENEVVGTEGNPDVSNTGSEGGEVTGTDAPGGTSNQ